MDQQSIPVGGPMIGRALLSLGAVVLLILLGVWLDRQWPRTQRIEHIVTKVEIPTKAETKPAKKVTPDSARAAVIQRIVDSTNVDSLKALLANRLPDRQQSFQDTVDVHDSLGNRFRGIALVNVVYRPIEDDIKMVRSWIEAELTGTIVHEKEELTWYERLYYSLPIAAVIVLAIELAKLLL